MDDIKTERSTSTTEKPDQGAPPEAPGKAPRQVGPEDENRGGHEAPEGAKPL